MKKSKNKFRIFVTLGSVGLAALLPQFLTAENELRPNIIVVVVDTLRTDYLGTYGFKGPISPHIDQLAKESIKFNRCITNAPWTKPAVASLFTSLYPETHRVTDHLGMHWKKVSKKVKSSVLSDEALTLAEVLLSAGYETVGYISNDFLIRRFGYQQGFQQYFEPRPDSDVFSSIPLQNKAIRMLQKGKIIQPFFMYMHFMDVHGPYQCDGRDFEVLSESESLGEDHLLTKRERRQIPNELGYRIPWRKTDQADYVRNWRNCYAAGVRKFDRRFGAFLNSLKELGLMDNSILIFTSDHGEELFEHKKWAHSHSLHTELMSIPLLIRLPGGEGGGKVVNETVSLLDIMPTLMNVAEIELGNYRLSGKDLTPLLMGKKAASPHYAFGSATRHDPNEISIQNKRYKLIWKYPHHKKVKLYDLVSDPLEKRNLARKKPQVVKQLKNKIKAHRAQLKKQGNLMEKTTLVSDELLEKLQTLGYMQ